MENDTAQTNQALRSYHMDRAKPAIEQMYLHGTVPPEPAASGIGFSRANLSAPQRHTGRLLTINQVAELLQVPRSWVYSQTRVRNRNRLPGLRLGKYWRFREAEVLAWLETQKS